MKGSFFTLVRNPIMLPLREVSQINLLHAAAVQVGPLEATARPPGEPAYLPRGKFSALSLIYGLVQFDSALQSFAESCNIGHHVHAFVLACFTATPIFMFQPSVIAGPELFWASLHALRLCKLQAAKCSAPFQQPKAA